MVVWNPRKETVDAAIAFSKEKCGCAHMELKREQRRVLTEVLRQKDSVVVLPTGQGKSLIYILLPFTDLFVRRDAGMTAAMENSVVLVVEQLTSLVEDQIKRAMAMNLQPTYLSYHQDLCSTEFKSGTDCNIGDCDRILYHGICTFCPFHALHLYWSMKKCECDADRLCSMIDTPNYYQVQFVWST